MHSGLPLLKVTVHNMVMKGDQTLGGKHTIEYTDIVLYCCTPEIYVMLLTNVTPINTCFKN